ncbi:hypothetical protein [Nostoc sp. ChiVER01]|nr:hypothetical protein [Nostoc sp. ChiVER01]
MNNKQLSVITVTVGDLTLTVTYYFLEVGDSNESDKKSFFIDN